MPPSAPNSLGEIRLERLRRLAELKARKAAKDAESAQNVAARFPLPGDLAKLIDPTTVVTPALKLLDANLLEVAEGDCERLIFSLPPQEGKSQRCSRYFPLWMLLRDPQLRIVIASYELGVARRWSRAIRNDIADHPELGLKLREDTAAAHEWQLMGHRGGLYAVGVGGGLTGRPADCLRADTQIITEYGYTSIHALSQSANPPRVLSFNHETGTAEWRAVTASRVVHDREVVEIVTTSGRRLTCTPDHRIYTSDGYREAALLQPGDTLTVGRTECSPRVRGVRQSAQVEEPHMQDVLHGGQGEHIPGIVMRPLRQQLFAHASGALKAIATWTNKFLLLRRLRTSIAKKKKRWAPLFALWSAHGVARSKAEILLAGVPFGGLSAETKDQGMSTVWSGFQVRQRATGALQSYVRRPGALYANDGKWKFSLQDGDQLRRVVQTDAAVDSSAGSTSVSSMLLSRSNGSGLACQQTANAEHPTGASHQRTPVGKLAREPDSAMQTMSFSAPQVSHDSVSVVRQLCGERNTVYDIQVEGNCNFFAGEILSHNCLIIDDPTKGRAEADSEAYQENSWEWWTETARTRLAPHAPVIVVQTRWHEMDLAGRLIEQDQGWRSINIPAQCETGDDPLGRDEGEYLISARGRTPEEWQQIQREVGDRAWSALYQGRPAPAEGGMFKRSWWQYDEIPVCYRKSDGTMHAQGMDVVIQSWDMTFKNTDGTDFVVGQVWGRAGATAHLLDQVRARMDFPQTCVAVEELSRKWPQATLKLIEDKANGPAVISQLRKTVPGMVPVNPEGNKQARANAVTPYVEAGNVCLPLPARAPWINGYLEEHAAFPTGSHDDQVDATTQALARLMLMPSSTAFLEELVNQR